MTKYLISQVLRNAFVIRDRYGFVRGLYRAIGMSVLSAKGENEPVALPCQILFGVFPSIGVSCDRPV